MPSASPENGSIADHIAGRTVNDFDPKAFVASLPGRPGVYRMLDETGQVIYVGKARNLRSRVSSYFRPDQLSPKVMALVRCIAGIEVTVTNSDTEALLLEYNLIKQHRPRYNVILRDDKSFPYLHLTAHEYPRLAFYRGTRKVGGRLFGPYPDARAARGTMHRLHKLFRIRGCKDSYFANRSRPCLEHQIGRCSAPCVGLISREAYARDVEAAIMVLEGRNEELAARLNDEMEQAAADLRFERAAALRDQLAALASLQAQQVVSSADAPDTDADVIAIATAGPENCVTLMFVRGGRMLGTTQFFPRAPVSEPEEVLGAFVMQHYLAGEAPREILTSLAVPDADLLSATLSSRAARSVTVRRPSRGIKARWIELASQNAENALRMRVSTRASIGDQLAELAAVLKLPGPPQRIECFDVSHTQGEATVASCVVFGPEGPVKQEYRRFNIEDVEPGDDYGALRQAILRRFRRIKAGESPLPDVLLIDGGAGQLAQAAAALDEAGLSPAIVVGVAKGADRRAGQERLFLLGHDLPSILPPDSRALHLIQRVRDEAHRFAITGHRRARSKSRQSSVLESVPGLGPSRRRNLLRHFGGLQGVVKAGVEDLMAVRGISRTLAETVYDHLHPGSR
jgi:excinuclease ABC subunit C